jgi:hypothetical protein
MQPRLVREDQKAKHVSMYRSELHGLIPNMITLKPVTFHEVVPRFLVSFSFRSPISLPI